MSDAESVNISKTMSYMLRHAKYIKKDNEGYVDINILLNDSKLRKYNITFDKIKKIVDTDNKNRYLLSPDNKLIRANQGHSIDNIEGVKDDIKGVKDDKDDLVYFGPEIDSNIMYAYHGTSIKNSKLIMKFGLSRMNRYHIHMVEDKKNVLYYSQVIIKIDILKAKELGIKFIQSHNNYILSIGDKNNIIPSECLYIEPI